MARRDSSAEESHRARTDHADDQPLDLSAADDRADRMRAVVDGWVEDLTTAIGETRASEQFQRWLDAQAAFHDYSYRNALLIKRQCPEATRVAGYRTWQEEFDRHVEEGESAIWIWAPITAPACPDCQNSPTYTDHDDCTYETPQDEWQTDVVGFRPVPVFDVSQTAGEPLPELDTAARGGSAATLDRVLTAGHEGLGLDVALVEPEAWSHGDAAGVCHHGGTTPTVRVKDRAPGATAGTLLHEYAHAVLHDGALPNDERAAREVEAETVAYLAGRRLGLDTERSARYLAAWDGDAAETVRERLGRIQRTTTQILDAVPASAATEP
jgi:hypothetical protein